VKLVISPVITQSLSCIAFQYMIGGLKSILEKLEYIVQSFFMKESEKILCMEVMTLEENF
jgi:hypothetical protein